MNEKPSPVDWAALEAKPEFRALLARKARFIVGATVFFMSYYLALPILVGYFPDLMKKPVLAGRLGDGFGWRIHPILRDRRFHEGVDYAAPFGSPIVAAADGMIEIIGEEAGYGKYVRVRHDFGYETTYAHISGVPRGLKVGSRIRRGQTIAYVGSTGLSTGPHLYFELRVNGHYADPLQANLRAGRVLDGGTLAAFQAARRRTDSLVQATE